MFSLCFLSTPITLRRADWIMKMASREFFEARHSIYNPTGKLTNVAINVTRSNILNYGKFVHRLVLDLENCEMLRQDMVTVIVESGGEKGIVDHHERRREYCRFLQHLIYLILSHSLMLLFSFSTLTYESAVGFCKLQKSGQY